MLKKSEVLTFLKEYKTKELDKKVDKIGIFGSFARDEALNDSDIDIVVEMHKADMFTLIKIKQDIEKHFMKKVDVIQLRDKMNKLLKNRILKDAIYI
jgi:predicted nucleotidyltransferase